MAATEVVNAPTVASAAPSEPLSILVGRVIDARGGSVIEMDRSGRGHPHSLRSVRLWSRERVDQLVDLGGEAGIVGPPRFGDADAVQHGGVVAAAECGTDRLETLGREPPGAPITFGWAQSCARGLELERWSFL
jgi:hypothetical protein